MPNGTKRQTFEEVQADIASDLKFLAALFPKLHNNAAEIEAAHLSAAQSRAVIEEAARHLNGGLIDPPRKSQ